MTSRPTIALGNALVGFRGRIRELVVDKAGVGLPGPELERILGIAAQTSFRAVAILPAILLIVFAAIWFYDRSKGGYRAQRLS